MTRTRPCVLHTIPHATSPSTWLMQETVVKIRSNALSSLRPDLRRSPEEHRKSNMWGGARRT